ncbi:MAG: C-type lectin domain-containing protein, partial [Planctomycetota bacterium]
MARQKLFSLTAALGVGGVAAVACAQDAVQWRVEDGGNGHWYAGVQFPSGVSWTAARAHAQVRGGDLVSLNTPAEREWVFEAVSSNNVLWTTTLGPWVGGYQQPNSAEPGGGWMWVDGTTVYSGYQWGPGHPDGNNNCGGPA